ncbi:MAG TPA: phosphatidylglycerol lysyltransferase domain-containing protein, partial [Desulfomonilia bacterium]|nr:phosphatidylglycerol lysyltransferase domain-containing protein [Desulfomonilia bacterium]
SLASENRVIKRVLEAWEHLTGIMGAVIYVDDKPAAFTVAEAIREDMLLIHFEKGLPDYTGIYQAVNQMFLERHQDFSLVNREPDLGDMGLRKSKLSYNPTDYIRKYRVIIT